MNIAAVPESDWRHRCPLLHCICPRGQSRHRAHKTTSFAARACVYRNNISGSRCPLMSAASADCVVPQVVKPPVHQSSPPHHPPPRHLRGVLRYRRDALVPWRSIITSGSRPHHGSRQAPANLSMIAVWT